MPDLSLLGQYGITGVMLALIALTGSSIWILWKIVSNHLSHSTEATIDMVKTLEKLATLIETKIK